MDIITTWNVSVASLAVGIVSLVYYYSTKNFDYWSSRGINGPKPWPLLGNMGRFFTSVPFLKDIEYMREYGRVYGLFNGRSPTLVIAEPELIKQITVKDFHIFPDRQKLNSSDRIMSKLMTTVSGNDWRRIRGTVSPTFTSGKMRKMLPLMDRCVDSLLDYLKVSAENKDSVDLKLLFGRYTTDVIANCCFATQTNAHTDPADLFMKHTLKFANPSKLKFILFFLLGAKVLEMLKIKLIPSDSMDYFSSVTKHLMEKRKDKNEKHHDFLQLLMDAANADKAKMDEREEDESHNVNADEEQIAADKKVFNVSKYLDEDEILAQSILFFVVGYETTGTLCTYSLLCLANNNDVQEKLLEELRRAVQANGGDLNYDTLSSCEYLDAVVSEVLRVHPPATATARQCNEDYEFKELGITLPAGTDVFVPVYAMHHDPEYFPNPEIFDPERFLPENRDKIIPYTYLPFGSGPRNCVGMRFALLEAKLAVARIVLEFKLRPSSDTVYPPQYEKGKFTLHSPGLVIGVEKRP